VAAGAEGRTGVPGLRIRRKLDEHPIPARRALKRPVLAVDGGQGRNLPGGGNVMRPR
jgi:hypothetical protein